MVKINSKGRVRQLRFTPFTPVTTVAEANDPTSWVNVGFEWPVDRYTDICAVLGEAIFAWAAVEGRLLHLYQLGLKSPQHTVVQGIWVSQVAFRAKLELAETALRHTAAFPVDFERWDKLRERARKKSLRRNAIAHGTLFYDHMEPRSDRKFFIASTKAVGLSDRIHVAEVASLRDAFRLLAGDIWDFTEAILTA